MSRERCSVSTCAVQHWIKLGIRQSGILPTEIPLQLMGNMAKTVPNIDANTAPEGGPT